MRKHTFLFSAIILLIGGVFAKVLGALYKVPLTHILGSNGMGIYYLIFPIYSMLLVVSSGGISLAVTQLIAKQNAIRNSENQRRIFFIGLLICFLISFSFSVLILIFANNISELQGNINANWGYLAISPAIICASAISIVKAYFQGKQNMIPSTLVVVCEQVLKLICGLFFSRYFLNKGLQFGVFGAVLGVSLSEIATLLFVVVIFLFNEKKSGKGSLSRSMKLDKKCIKKLVKVRKSEGEKCKFCELKSKYILPFSKIFKLIFKFSFFSTISNLIIPASSLIDSFLIINILNGNGFSSTVSTSLYGLSNGIISSLISFPVMVLVSLSTVIVPNLSHVAIIESKEMLEKKCSFFIKFSWTISIFMFLVFVAFSEEIISILFSNGLSNSTVNEYAFAYRLLMVASVSIVYYGFLQTFIAILNALNKHYIPTISLIISLIFRISLMLILINNKEINVFGSVIANVVFLGIASLICVFYLRRYININFGIVSGGVYPILCGIITFSFVFCLKLLLKNVLNIWIYCSVCGLSGAILFLVLVKRFRVFNSFEVDYLNIKFKKISFLTKRI